MDEKTNEFIDFKFVVYRTMRAWKLIIALSLALAMLLGIGAVAVNSLKLLDADFVEEAKVDFEREHASWAATEENLLFQLDNLEKTKQRQLEYNEKSILMKIDPLRKNVASFQLHIKYEPELLGQFQIKDLSNTILSSYATYMTNGEMYNYILQNLSYEIESRYLGEILSVSVDYDANMISASIVHTDAAKCQEILGLVENGIRSRYKIICDSVDEHEILSINGSAYETIDLSLQDTQEENLQYINNIDIAIQGVGEKMNEWKRQPEPEYAYSAANIVMGGIKTAIIGGVVGVLAFAVIVAVATVVSGKLLNPEDLQSRFGIHVIGKLPSAKGKKSFARLSNRISKIGGIKIKEGDYESLAKMIGSYIRSDMASTGNDGTKTVVFTGMSALEDMQKAISAMGAEGYNAICAPDILTNAESIDKVSSADYVVLAETQDKTALSDVAKELEILRAWNKHIIGAVVLECDSII